MLALNEASTAALGDPGLRGTINPATTRPPATYLRRVKPFAENGPASEPDISKKMFAAHAALSKLTQPDQQALLRRSRIRTVRRKEVIYRKGDPTSSLLLVLDGYVKLSWPLANGSEMVLDIAGPSGCVGDFVTIMNQAHDAYVTTLSPRRLLLIDAGNPGRPSNTSQTVWSRSCG
jgi:CRP-like cAMP-binding protein